MSTTVKQHLIFVSGGKYEKLLFCNFPFLYEMYPGEPCYSCFVYLILAVCPISLISKHASGSRGIWVHCFWMSWSEGLRSEGIAKWSLESSEVFAFSPPLATFCALSLGLFLVLFVPFFHFPICSYCRLPKWLMCPTLSNQLQFPPVSGFVISALRIIITSEQPLIGDLAT